MADSKLVELAAARKALDRHWRGRGLLSGDLPEAYTSAVRDADAALEAGAAGPAEQALGRARAAIDGVVIDRELVNRKLTRLNAKIERLPDDRADEYTVLLRDVLASVNADDFPAANRKLNAIASRLGFEK